MPIFGDMKNLCLLIGLVFIFSCTKKKDTTHEPVPIKSTLTFSVSDGSNIGSYNVYRDGDLVGQVATSLSDAEGIYLIKEEITKEEYQKGFSYSVEPLFYDSANANVNLVLEVQIDDNEPIRTTTNSVMYKDIARIKVNSK